MTARVVLVGPMGVGKTTVGRVLARKLELPSVDTDQAMEARYGKSAAMILREDPLLFRQREAELVSEYARAEHDLVLSVGGGAVLDQGTQRVLKELPVVWLQARPEVLVERVLTSDTDRPLLDGDPIERMRTLAEERRRHYENVAQTAVNVEDRTPAQVAEVIMEWLNSGTEHVT